MLLRTKTMANPGGIRDEASISSVYEDNEELSDDELKEVVDIRAT